MHTAPAHLYCIGWRLPMASAHPFIHMVSFAPSNIRDHYISINIKFIVPFRPFLPAPSCVHRAEGGMAITECSSTTRQMFPRHHRPRTASSLCGNFRILCFSIVCSICPAGHDPWHNLCSLGVPDSKSEVLHREICLYMPRDGEVHGAEDWTESRQ